MKENYSQPPEDLSDAVEAVAEEMDSRRTFWESFLEALRTARLLLEITWTTSAGGSGDGS